MYYIRHTQKLVFIANSNLDLFGHIHVLFRIIQRYWDMIRTLYNSCIFRVLPLSEYWHIWNPICIQKSVKTYSVRCITLTYWEPWPIFRILTYLRPKAYLSQCLFRHIKSYSRIIAIITLTLILHTFQQDLKRHIFFDCNDLNFNVPLNVFKQYEIFENNVIIE